MRVSEPLLAATDQELLARVRGGETGAYGELWRRHSGAVTAILRLETRLDADDLTAEVFTRILAAIRSGNGPDAAFRPYALVAARNLAAEWGKRGRREIPVAEESLDAESTEPPVDESVVVLPHRHVAARVFSSLPVRWQEVLWYLEVEQLAAAETAPLVGLNPNSTVQLAFRAREGFRQAWIQEHLRGRPAGTPDCAWVDRRVGRHVRGKLTAVERGKLERHAAVCERCTALIDEGRSVESRAIFVLLPVLILGGTATGYLAAAAEGETRRSEAEPGGTLARGAPRLGSARFAKTGGRTRSRPAALVASAGAIAAAVVIAVVGIALAQSTVEPIQAAQAGEPAVGDDTRIGIPATPRPGVPVGPTTQVPPEASAPDEQEDRRSPVDPPVGAAAPPVGPVEPSTSVLATVASAGELLNGLAYPSVIGFGIPGAMIEIMIDPNGFAYSITGPADGTGHFKILAVAPKLSGPQPVIVRQHFDGLVSEWTAPFDLVLPAAPSATWSWLTPGKLQLVTSQVEPGFAIQVQIDGVDAGVVSTTTVSGETAIFTTASVTPNVTIRYVNGGEPSPTRPVPQV